MSLGGSNDKVPPTRPRPVGEVCNGVPTTPGKEARVRHAVKALIAAAVTAIALAPAAGAIPDQGTPEFDTYMQGLERNGFNLNPDTAWRVAHQACEGGLPGYIGLELAAQGVIGPGADQRLMDVARKYACPVQ